MVADYFFANLLDDIGILSSFHFNSCGKMGKRLNSVYLEPTLDFLHMLIPINSWKILHAGPSVRGFFQD